MSTRLTQEQIDHFIQYGFLHLPGSFDVSPGSVAGEWVRDSWVRYGFDPDDMATWPLDKIHMPHTESRKFRELAPAAYAAIAELCGEERLQGEPSFGNGFIANYGWGRDKPWVPPGPEAEGWHKDGDFFRHFLDSPEQGLLIVVYYTDVGEKGGGTYIAPDSIGVVARYLAERPEGVRPTEFPTGENSLTRQCRDFREVTGKAGDVFLLHPYMLHASSRNHSPVARLMTNPCIHLNTPLVFNRTDGSRTSPVEQAVLNGLGMESLDFQIAVPREKIIPERIAMQRRLLEQEKERKRKLAEAG